MTERTDTTIEIEEMSEREREQARKEAGLKQDDGGA